MIAAISVLYAHNHRQLAAPKVRVLSPSAEFEVDPTRWRHNGEQPTWTQNGNQSHIIDEQSAYLIETF